MAFSHAALCSQERKLNDLVKREPESRSIGEILPDKLLQKLVAIDLANQAAGI